MLVLIALHSLLGAWFAGGKNPVALLIPSLGVLIEGLAVAEAVPMSSGEAAMFTLSLLTAIQVGVVLSIVVDSKLNSLQVE